MRTRYATPITRLPSGILRRRQRFEIPWIGSVHAHHGYIRKVFLFVHSWEVFSPSDALAIASGYSLSWDGAKKTVRKKINEYAFLQMFNSEGKN